MAAIPGTKDRLADSLKELLRTRSINDISVGDIADNAGLSTRTFYNHFRDKLELLGYCYRRLVEQFWYSGGKRNSLEVFFSKCGDYLSIRENLRNFGNALSYYGQNDLRTEMENYGVEALVRLLRWNGYPGEIAPELRETLHFFTCGISRFCELYYIYPNSLDVDWLFAFWINCLPHDIAEYLSKDPA